jgi:energy-coupling factor transporter ATP-binding protein EcfA2
MSVESLSAALVRLREAAGAVRLPLELPGAQQALTRAREQAAQLDDYVLPRLGRLDAPLLAVIGGSTGAGKSTLLNSLLGTPVSAAGVIRPTTRAAVLVHHPDDAAWFASSQVLPGLARSDGPTHDVRALQLVADPSVPRGLAVLDAPDLDSVVAENRALAGQLLAAADLWLFVTSAARYADAVPWDYLRSAAERNAVVAVVLDRLPPAALDDIPAHLGQMMSQRGLADSPLFAVPETEVDADGLLPEAAIAPVRAWLSDLAQDAVRRNEVVVQTLDGAIAALAGSVPQVADAIEAQQAALETLRGDVATVFAVATETISAQTADGSLLRGEVLARWQDFIGTGEFFRAVEQKIGRLRDRLTAAVKGEPRQVAQVKLAVESGLEILLREEGEAAVRRAAASWQAHPAGRRLLTEELTHTGPEFGESAAQAVRDWQGDVLTLVAGEGQQKKTTARYLALGVNGIGVALMILVFSQTGGLLGAEVGIAGGTAVLAQRLLEAVFGEDAVRRLAKQAKQQLDVRTDAVLAAEADRFFAVLDRIEVHGEQAVELRSALAEVDRARAQADRFTAEPAATRPAIPVPAELAALAAEVTRRPQPSASASDEEVEHS